MKEEKIDPTELTVATTPPLSPLPSPQKPEASSAGQYILRRECVKGRRNMDPMDVKNVYRSTAQIQRAVKNGTFEISKTMHMRNNNMYWLCYENVD